MRPQCGYNPFVRAADKRWKSGGRQLPGYKRRRLVSRLRVRYKSVGTPWEKNSGKRR